MISKKMTLVCVLGLAACKIPAPPEPESAVTPVAPVAMPQPTRPKTQQQPTAAAKRPGDKPTAKELPVPEDFHPEVTATIVRANYRAELDALETELHAEAQ